MKMFCNRLSYWTNMLYHAFNSVPWLIKMFLVFINTMQKRVCLSDYVDIVYASVSRLIPTYYYP